MILSRCILRHIFLWGMLMTAIVAMAGGDDDYEDEAVVYEEKVGSDEDDVEDESLIEYVKRESRTINEDDNMNERCRDIARSYSYEEILPDSFEAVEIKEVNYETPPDRGWILDILSVLMKVLVFAILCFALYFLIKHLPSLRALFASKKKEEIVQAKIEQDVKFESESIFGHDYRAETRAALERGDFRKAVRIAYLTTLAHLHQRKTIVCKESKTPTEYYYEVSERKPSANEPFHGLTSTFLAASYGEREPVREDFDRADSLRAQIFKIMGILLVAVTLTSCTVSRDWNRFGVGIFWSCVAANSTHEEFAITKVYVGSRKIFELEGDLLVHHFKGRCDTIEKELWCYDKDIAECLSNNRRALVNAECFFVRSGSEVLSLVEGSGYHVDSLAADINENGKPRMLTLRYEPDGKEYQYPYVMGNCHLDMEALLALTERVRAMCPDVKIGQKVLLTVDGRPAIWRLQSSNGGQFVVSSLPLLFSEYGIRFNDGNWTPLIFRIVRDTYLREKAFVRLTYGSDYQDLHPYRVFKSSGLTVNRRHVQKVEVPDEEGDDEDHTWAIAFWSLVCLLPLLMRRRQRIIPYVPQPSNKTTELVRHAAAIYENQGDFTALVLKRYAVFSSVLSDTLHIEITSPDALLIIVAATGLSKYEVTNTLSLLIPVVKKRTDITAEAMADLVRRMERIEDSLTRKSSR